MWKTFSPSESNLYDTGSDLGFVPGLSLAPHLRALPFGMYLVPCPPMKARGVAMSVWRLKG